MSIDLTAAQSQEVCRILRSVLSQNTGGQPLQAWVFGSRATGRARPFSDLDVLIVRPEGLSWRERADLADALEASDLPFRVDIVEADRVSQGMIQRVMAERQVLL